MFETNSLRKYTLADQQARRTKLTNGKIKYCVSLFPMNKRSDYFCYCPVFRWCLSLGLKDESAWNLATNLGECVFRTLNEVRSGVSNSFDLKHPKALATTVSLTVVRTHDAIALFMVKDFKNHSAISGKHIKFVVQNNNSEELSTYKEWIVWKKSSRS